MNKVFLVGNLTSNPELRMTPDGTEVCSMRIAVSRGKQSEVSADFFNVTAWKKLGIVCAQYLSKGKKIAVNGKLKTSKAEKNGVKFDRFEVVAEEIEFLSSYDGEA